MSVTKLLFCSQAAEKLLIFKGPQGSKRGRLSFENEMPALHHEILSILLSVTAVEER